MRMQTCVTPHRDASPYRAAALPALFSYPHYLTYAILRASTAYAASPHLPAAAAAIRHALPRSALLHAALCAHALPYVLRAIGAHPIAGTSAGIAFALALCAAAHAGEYRIVASRKHKRYRNLFSASSSRLITLPLHHCPAPPYRLLNCCYRCYLLKHASLLR